MKTKKDRARGRSLGIAVAVLACGGVLALLAGGGCTGPRTGLTSPSPEYLRAREAGTALEAGSARERAALQGVMELFAEYTVENIRARVRDVYADEFFFRDGFKHLTRLDALEAYMVHGAEALRSCTFTFEEPIRSGSDYYLKWIMDVSLLRDAPDEADRILGMSHLRFNAAGKVVFHQDYWDPGDVLYRRIPVAGWMVHTVREMQ